MALTSRILPFAEWKILAGTELAHLAALEHEAPAVTVLVVEEDDGLGPPEVVACWASIQTIHVEGLWHAPAVRKRAAVGRALLNGMMTILRAQGAAEVVTNALDPEVETMLTKIGGRQVPGSLWVFPVPQE